MAYEMKVQDMIYVRDIAKQVISGVLGNTIDHKTANTLNNAAGTIIRANKQDLSARLAMSELIESEAKMVEMQNKPAPEQIAAA